MTIRFRFWLANLPFYLIEVFICNLVGHKPAEDMKFIEEYFGETICTRCYAKIPLKKDDVI